MIKDLVDGGSANGYYLVKDVSKCLTNAGKAYLKIHFQDSSGTIDAKKWDNITEHDIKILVPGNIVKIVGSANDYKGKLQIKVLNIEEADPQDSNISDFIVESPIPVLTLVEKFKKYLASVKNSDCKAILNEIFSKHYNDFINFPAAVKNHHEFYHGLLFHTVSMCDVADFLASHYPNIDRDLLISGCLLHDIGKIKELSGPVATKYTDEGNLLGHLTIGMSMVRDAAEKLNLKSEVPLLLEHMILSHHGKLEFGSAVLPRTREALLLSMIDDMDAKMMILDKAYDEVEPGEYTEKIFALDNRTFYKEK